MKKYEKPVVLLNEEIAEGVYAASGVWSDDCIEGHAFISQSQSQTLSDNYAVQITVASHKSGYWGGDGHSSQGVQVTLSFNQAVSCDGAAYDLKCPYSVVSGSGTPTLVLNFNLGMNPTGSYNLGQIYVKSAAGLSLNGSSFLCSNAV